MNKENNFSILHIFAACMVFVGHMYVLLGFSAPRLLNTPVHGLGVSILFFIIVLFVFYKKDVYEPWRRMETKKSLSDKTAIFSIWFFTNLQGNLI